MSAFIEKRVCENHPPYSIGKKKKCEAQYTERKTKKKKRE